MRATKDIMKLQQLHGDKDPDLASMQPISPDYNWDQQQPYIDTSVARQNDNSGYMAGPSNPPASMQNTTMDVQLQGGGNIGWNNSDGTVPPATGPTGFNTDDIYTGDYGSQALNLSWNMLNGQAIPRDGGSDLIGWVPPFGVRLASLSAQGQATGSAMPPADSEAVLLNAEHKAQPGTQHRLRGRGKPGQGKDRKGRTFDCKECEMTFRGPYELKRHLMQTNKHGGPKFQCPRCGHLLSRRDGLEKHRSNPRACRAK